MTDQQNCHSCGMNIEMGTYCQYCVDNEGKLRDFHEMFERMVQWTLKNSPNMERPEAEDKTRDYMRKMPAWENHSALA